MRDAPALDSPSAPVATVPHARSMDHLSGARTRFRGLLLNAASDRTDAAARTARPPLRDHVANSVRRYLRDLNGSGTENLYDIALRELEIPLFAEVLNYCDGNHSRAAVMLGIHRATLRKKLKDYGLA